MEPRMRLNMHTLTMQNCYPLGHIFDSKLSRSLSKVARKFHNLKSIKQ